VLGGMHIKSDVDLWIPFKLWRYALRLGLVLLPKNFKIPVTSNLAAHAWSIKFRRKQKLIIQFVCKSRDESFDHN